MRRSLPTWLAVSGALLATMLILVAGAEATRAGSAQQVAVSLQIANPRPGPGGAIIPAGETVTVLVSVKPAQLLTGDGGRLVAQVRGAKNMSHGPQNFEALLEKRLQRNAPYTSKICRRSPCRLQIRSRTEAVWDFKAVLLRGSTATQWSPSVRVVWHTDPRSVTLEGTGFSCTKRLPNSGVSGDGLICRGTVTLPSKEEVLVVPNGTQVQLTGRASPGIPVGWSLKVAETGRVICEVPRRHSSTTNQCTGFAAEGSTPEFRTNRAWSLDLKLLEYAGLTGPGIGIFGSLHEFQIWWGCPFRGLIPQCS